MSTARAGVAELGLVELSAYLALMTVVLETHADDPGAAAVAARNAVEIATAAGDRWTRSGALVELAGVLADGGSVEEASKALDDVERDATPTDVEWRVKRHRARAALALRRGDVTTAVAEARAAVTEVAPTEFLVASAAAHHTLAMSLRAAGQLAEASAAAGAAVTLARTKENAVALGRSSRLVAELRDAARV
jgi:hypothetical protein